MFEAKLWQLPSKVGPMSAERQRQLQRIGSRKVYEDTNTRLVKLDVDELRPDSP